MNIKIPNQKEIVEHYGIETQSTIWLEEIIEIAYALQFQGKEHIKEEFSDLLICMQQMEDLRLIEPNNDDPLLVVSFSNMQCVKYIYQVHQALSKYKRYGYDKKILINRVGYNKLSALYLIKKAIIDLYAINDEEIQEIIDFKYKRKLRRMNKDGI